MEHKSQQYSRPRLVLWMSTLVLHLVIADSEQTALMLLRQTKCYYKYSGQAPSQYISIFELGLLGALNTQYTHSRHHKL